VAAFTNDGGIRTGLDYKSLNPGLAGGSVTYGELFDAQPFGNALVTMTLTGAQIKTLLEEQFAGCGLGSPAGEAPPASTRRLQVSQGFSYSWSRSAAPCSKVDTASIRIGGVPVVPAGKYRITVNNLLADGGEQFFVLKQGTGRRVGVVDLDAMLAYFAKHSPVKPVAPNRITVIP
jgi:5'-nucleotidase